MGADFAKYLDAFKPYLYASLDAHEDPQVCTAAIGVISDLCRAFEARISSMTDELMQKLIAILEVSASFGRISCLLNSFRTAK